MNYNTLHSTDSQHGLTLNIAYLGMPQNGYKICLFA
jgi:hypothetical protein